MTRKEQEQFVKDLTKTVRDSLLGDLPRVPEDWDGNELRQWIADRFKNQVTSPLKGKRKRDYKNAVIVKNL